MVVEPVRAHGLAEITGDVDDSAVTIGVTCAGIGSIGVDRVRTCKDHGPAIVVELSREEEGVGETIAFGRVVTVVFVGGEGVSSKAHVGCDVDGQGVVVAHQEPSAIAHAKEFGGQGAVPGPEGFLILERHVRVKLNLDARGRALGP